MRQGGDFYKNQRQTGLMRRSHFTGRVLSYFWRVFSDFMMTKMIIRLVSITALLGLFGLAARGSERWEALQAINWVENPTNHSRMGAHGELGPYQFRMATWRMHTAHPFSLAVQRQYADEVAVKHYEWIKAGLERAGIQPVPFNIALAWNGGLDAVVNGRAPTASYLYAARVQNLVEKLQRQQRTVGADSRAPQTAAAASAPQFVIATDALRFVVATGGPRFLLAAN